MILHQDGLIELVYEPKTDILSVKWPDLRLTATSAIQYSFTKLIDTINHYHITKLLIDSSGNSGEVDNQDYQALALKLSRDLAATRLEKVARIISADKVRESRTQAYAQEIKAVVSFKLVSQEFEEKASAIAWLMGKEDGSPQR